MFAQETAVTFACNFQVAVPSRTDVKEYQELKEDIDKLVGCINGHFSTPSWSPIRLVIIYFIDKLVGCILIDSSPPPLGLL